MAVVRTVDVVDVDVPAAAAWAVLEDVTRNPTWQSGMRSCTWTSPPPIGEGSTYEQEAGFLGRTIRSSFVVRDHEPGRSVTITSTAGTFPITVTRRVDPLGPLRCRVTRDVRGEPTGLLGLLMPLAEGRFQRQVAADGRALANLLEAAHAA